MIIPINNIETSPYWWCLVHTMMVSTYCYTPLRIIMRNKQILVPHRMTQIVKFITILFAQSLWCTMWCILDVFVICVNSMSVSRTIWLFVGFRSIIKVLQYLPCHLSIMNINCKYTMNNVCYWSIASIHLNKQSMVIKLMYNTFRQRTEQ